MQDAEKIVDTLLEDDDPKEFVADIQLPHVNTTGGHFEVNGSYGTLFCDTTTGNVVKYDEAGEHGEDGYDDIVRVDLAEFTQWLDRLEKKYPGAGQRQNGCDILFIGFWTKDGEYGHPEEDARQDYELQLAEDFPPQ